MRIEMQESESGHLLSMGKYDVAIVGKELDDRGRAAIDFLRNRTGEIHVISYDPDNFEFDAGSEKLNGDQLSEFFSPFSGNSIVLEATTLGFVEIFLSCRAFIELGFTGITLLYVEPLTYSGLRRTDLLHRRDFDLSEEFPGYRAIPGATAMLTDRYPQAFVFFLGYEERRLDRALEDYQMIRPSRCCVVFGVPAFKPGWEMDSFANNIRVLRDKNIRGGVHFCGAENPAAAYEVLEELHEGLGDDERMFVAPIGTKPHGIGCALFVATHRDIGVLYDHPKRREGRSEDVSTWHLFKVNF